MKYVKDVKTIRDFNNGPYHPGGYLYIYKGSPAAVTTSVCNTGKAGAENFGVALYIYSGDIATLVDTKSVSSLAYGNSTGVEFTWTPSAAGEFTLKAIADSGNAVAEANETNNELTKIVNVEETQIETDVNGDGQVNVLDMVLIGQKWGQTGIPGWIKEDVNKDGKIDVLDMIVVGQHWTG